jgi:hypothetical protein
MDISTLLVLLGVLIVPVVLGCAFGVGLYAAHDSGRRLLRKAEDRMREAELQKIAAEDLERQVFAQVRQAHALLTQAVAMRVAADQRLQAITQMDVTGPDGRRAAEWQH